MSSVIALDFDASEIHDFMQVDGCDLFYTAFDLLVRIGKVVFLIFTVLVCLNNDLAVVFKHVGQESFGGSSHNNRVRVLHDLGQIRESADMV